MAVGPLTSDTHDLVGGRFTVAQNLETQITSKPNFVRILVRDYLKGMFGLRPYFTSKVRVDQLDS